MILAVGLVVCIHFRFVADLESDADSGKILFWPFVVYRFILGVVLLAGVSMGCRNKEGQGAALFFYYCMSIQQAGADFASAPAVRPAAIEGQLAIFRPDSIFCPSPIFAGQQHFANDPEHFSGSHVSAGAHHRQGHIPFSKQARPLSVRFTTILRPPAADRAA